MREKAVDAEKPSDRMLRSAADRTRARLGRVATQMEDELAMFRRDLQAYDKGGITLAVLVERSMHRIVWMTANAMSGVEGGVAALGEQIEVLKTDGL